MPGGMQGGMMAGDERKSRNSGLNSIRLIQEHGWRPELDLAQRLRRAGAKSDAEIAAALCQDLIAIPVTPGMIAGPQAWLTREREAAGVAAGALLDSPKAEELLRGLAHLILSLPESQLH
jgi:hypothetical protein